MVPATAHFLPVTFETRLSIVVLVEVLWREEEGVCLVL
jgi:hypothetical protein